MFVSSTFADLKAERDALQEFVYPRISEFCAHHGCQFQAIDLRWGITAEANAAQETLHICLEELARCQRTTPRPNLIVLLGDRYGWRPLPEEIPAAEFQVLLADLSIHAPGAADRARRWYRLDKNAHVGGGGVYVLRPQIDAPMEPGTWRRSVEQPLRAALADAALRCGMPPQTLSKYLTSATAQEIEQGVFLYPQASEHVLCFFRTILGSDGKPIAQQMPRDPVLGTFLNLTDTGELDTEAENLLTELKESLRSTLDTNVHEYTAQWVGGDISKDHIGSIPGDLSSCVELLFAPDSAATLCVDVWRRLMRMILPQIALRAEVDSVEAESTEHSRFANDYCQFFVGRTAALDSISGYLASPDRRPFIVRGPSGIGKSALLAEAYKRAKKAWPSSVVVVRFVRETPRANVSMRLVEDIAAQIHRERGDGGAEGTVFADFSLELMRRLEILSSGGPVLVFLDGYDELDQAPPFMAQGPLPKTLPPKTKLVLSMTGTCPAPTEELGFCLGELPPGERRLLMECWLSAAGRTLTEPQWKEVAGKIGTNGVPLYLRLVFQTACRWRSDESEPITMLATDIAGLLNESLNRLSSGSYHSDLFVSKAFSYLAASEHGLAEDDLLSIMGRDDAVFDDFLQRSQHDLPPLSKSQRHLPIAIWARLRHDAGWLLTEHGRDDSPRLGIRGGAIRSAVQARFLAGGVASQTHRLLAEYWRSANPGRITHFSKLRELEGDTAYVIQGSDEALEITNRKVTQSMASDTLPFQYAFARGFVTAAGEGLVGSRQLPNIEDLAMNYDAMRLCNEGHELFEQRRYEEAIRRYDEALTIKPLYARALSNKGTALGRLGRTAEAMKCYAMALKSDPSDSEALYNAGWSLAQSGHHVEALSYYDASIASYVKDGATAGLVRSLNMKAHSLFALKKFREAAEVWKKAEERESQGSRRDDIRYNIAHALAQDARYEDALPYYDRVLASRPNDAQVLHNKAVTLYKLNRIEEAATCFSRAQEIDPKFGLH